MAFNDTIAVARSSWQQRTDVPALSGQTHIWAVSLRESPAYQDTLYQFLSSRERSKAERVIIPKKKDYQIQARGWLRWLLASYTNLKPDEIAYQYGPLGKPSLRLNNDTIQFNATDSGDLLLCAFSNHHEVGIDVESSPRKVSYQRIGEKMFTCLEQRIVLNYPTTQQSDAFLALWTRKEAYGKAIGQGIHYPMRRVNLCDSLDTPDYKITDDKDRNWSLIQFSFDNYIACLTSTENSNSVKYYNLDIEKLMKQGG